MVRWFIAELLEAFVAEWLVVGQTVGLVGTPSLELAVLMYQTSSLDTTLSKFVSSAQSHMPKTFETLFTGLHMNRLEADLPSVRHLLPPISGAKTMCKSHTATVGFPGADPTRSGGLIRNSVRVTLLTPMPPCLPQQRKDGHNCRPGGLSKQKSGQRSEGLVEQSLRKPRRPGWSKLMARRVVPGKVGSSVCCVSC